MDMMDAMPQEFEAYGVFGGGGMRGVALAGALKAAQELGIRFRGYGGVSAGSVIALLAAAGYTGDELVRILKTDARFVDLLDDGGDALYEMGDTFNDIKALGNSEEFQRFQRARRRTGKLAWIGEAAAGWRLYRSQKALIERAERLFTPIYTQFGLYTGEPAVRFLRKLIEDKLPSLRGVEDISFRALREAVEIDPDKRVKLKILATDIHTGKGVMFGDEKRADTDQVNRSVLDAVRASISYPFVFRPKAVGDTYCVDGGVTNGLPVYLFEPSFQRTKVPIIAFELGDDARAARASYSLYDYASDLLDATINPFDATERIKTEGIYPIQLRIRRELGMHFRASLQTLDRMARDGEAQARPHLERVIEVQPWARQRRSRLAGHVELLLYSLVRHLNHRTSFEDCRAYIMLRTAGGRRKVRYSYNMSAGLDCDMLIGLEAGPSGKAWTANDVVLTPLDTYRAMGLPSNELPPDNQIAMISAPLREYWGTRGPVADPLLKRLGTVSVDFTAGSKGTGTPMGMVVREYDETAKDLVAKWADIISVQLRYESLDDGG